MKASAAPGVSAIQPGLPLPATSSPYHHWLLTVTWPAAAVVPSWPAAGRLAAARPGRRAGGGAGRCAPKEASGGMSLVRGVSHLVRGKGRGRARGGMRLVRGGSHLVSGKGRGRARGGMGLVSGVSHRSSAPPSPISRLYLPYISPISPYISPRLAVFLDVGRPEADLTSAQGARQHQSATWG